MSLPRTKVAIPVELAKGSTRAGIAIQLSGAGAGAANAINQSGIMPGNLITAQRFVPGSNTYVRHGLSRIPRGYILCNVRADPTQTGASAAPGCQRNTTADPTNNELYTLSLGPFQPFLADVWVY